MDVKEKDNRICEITKDDMTPIKRYNVAKNTYEMLKATLSKMSTESKSYDTVFEEVASAKKTMESLWHEAVREEGTPNGEAERVCKCNMFLVHFPEEMGINPSLVRNVKYVDGNINSFVVTFIDTKYNGIPPYELYKKIRVSGAFIDITIDKLETMGKELIYKEVHKDCVADGFKYCEIAPSLDYEDDGLSTFSIKFISSDTYQM